MSLRPKAVAFLEALQPDFKDYQKSVIENAQTLGKALQEQGFPVDFGGTDTHLLVGECQGQKA